MHLACSKEELALSDLGVTTLVSIANDLSKTINETCSETTDKTFRVICDAITERRGQDWMNSHVTCPVV